MNDIPGSGASQARGASADRPWVAALAIAVIIIAALIETIAQLGSAWNARVDALQQRLTRLETRVDAYDAIATSPAVLQKALDALSVNDDVRALYERGGAYRISRTTVLDCRRVAVPREPAQRIWSAGLQPPRAPAPRSEPGRLPRPPASALADRRSPNSRAARDIIWEAPG